jgi:Cdc6-like AAA superfamily ATPase
MMDMKKFLSENETIFKDPVALDYDYIPKIVPYRDAEQKEILFAIKPLFHNRNGKNIFIYGRPGIGKTLICKSVLKELSETTDEVLGFYINCWKKNTTYKIAMQLADELSLPFVQTKRTDEILDAVKREINKKSAVFVFDEADKIEDYSFLYYVLEEIYRKTVIVIANSREWIINLDSRIRSRLLPETIQFREYNRDEIKGILLNRIKYAFNDDVVTEDALNMIINKTYESKDIRVGLFLLKEAGNNAEARSSKQLEKKDVIKAIESLESFSIKSSSDFDDETKQILEVCKENSGKKIGELYGNTKTAQKVDVSINKMGEIQIKDVNSGKLITDFYMVASDRDENSLEDVVKNGDYIVEFQKSNFNSIRNLDTIKANNGYFDNRIFKFGSIFRLIDNSRDALPSDLIQNIIGSKAIRSGDGSIQTIDHLTLRGTDTNGNSVNAALNITSTTTMQDLIDKIKSNFGDVDVKIEKGELIITDNSLTNKNDTSKFSVSIEADDSSGNKLQVFRSKDVVNFDKLFMGKNGNLIESNKTQIIKDYKTYIKDGVIYKIENPDAQGIATDDTSLTDVMGTDEMSQTLEIRFRDKNGDFNTAKIVLQDSEDSDGHLSYFEINGNKYDIFDSQGNKTPAHDIITTYSQTDPNNCKICQKEKKVKGFTFRQLGDVISMITSGNVPANNDESDYFTALDNAKKEVKSGMENGKFYIKDLNNNPSKIDISIFDENDNISFQANDAITIDSAKVDFFSMLQNAINAVKNGTNYPDGNSDNPRNFGIQGAIEEIDHLSDHVRKLHAKIGAVSNEFDMSIERVDALTIHTKTLQSKNIDTDIGEATMRLNSLKTSYQALLASIAKVNDLTLLNYLR